MADTGRLPWQLGPDDVPQIASFLTQLGYRTTAAQASAGSPSSTPLARSSSVSVWTACSWFGAGRLDWTLQRDEPVGRIIGLAVTPEALT